MVLIAARIDANPVAGTWKLNLAKSTFGGVPVLNTNFVPIRSLRRA